MRKSLDPFQEQAGLDGSEGNLGKPDFQEDKNVNELKKNEMPTETNYLKIKGLINLTNGQCSCH